MNRWITNYGRAIANDVTAGWLAAKPGLDNDILRLNGMARTFGSTLTDQYVLALSSFAAPAGEVRVEPAPHIVKIGQSFDVTITLDLKAASRGAQAGLSFTPSVLRLDSVSTGTFYDDWAAASGASTTVFPNPTVNNTLGKMNTGAVIALGGNGGAAGTGSLFVLRFTAIGGGDSSLHLTSVSVADADVNLTQAVPVTLTDGQIAARYLVYLPGLSR